METKKQQEALNAAETAVKKLENDQKRENVDDAKNKVTAVADSTKKEAFNNRINAVVSAIDAKEAEAARQAEEAKKAQEAEAARQAQEQAAAAAQQGDSTTVYITRTGNRYHLSPYCRGLNPSKILHQQHYQMLLLLVIHAVNLNNILVVRFFLATFFFTIFTELFQSDILLA